MRCNDGTVSNDIYVYNDPQYLTKRTALFKFPVSLVYDVFSSCRKAFGTMAILYFFFQNPCIYLTIILPVLYDLPAYKEIVAPHIDSGLGIKLSFSDLIGDPMSFHNFLISQPIIVEQSINFLGQMCHTFELC